MKRILATTALTASLCMPAFAQDAQTTEDNMAPEAGAEMQAEGGFIQSADEQNVMASDFIGKRVYAMAEDAEYGDEGIADAQEGWEDIGEVSDVIMTRAGEIQGVIVDVGGFLGIGEKPVALTMDSLELVSDSNSPGDYFVTVTSTREALDQAPAYERMDPAAEGMEQAAAEGDATVAEEAPTEEMAEGDAAMEGENADMAEETADAGEAVEDTAEEAGDEMAEAGEAMEETGEEATEEMAEAGESVEQSAEEAGDEMAEAGEAVENTAEEAGDEMAEAGEAVEETGEEATEEMAEAGENAEDAMTPETDMAEGDAAAVEGESEMMAEGETDGQNMEGFEREGFSQVMVTDLSSDDLTGLPVYDPSDNRVGEISEVLISADGVVTDAVIDVGGFLGIGEKPVAISFEGISLQQQTEGEELRAYVNTTEEQLESFPEYDGG